MNENEIITNETDCPTESSENIISEEIEAEVSEEQESQTEDIPAEEDPAAVIDSLRAQLSELRTRLDEERAVYARMNEECAEFAELYPSVSLSSLSDSIWESVKKGVPIAAAYALEERRAAIADMKADAVNRSNRQRSSGSIDSPAAEEYFTPDEVRAMSPSQVRANYTKIINSMSKWH